MDVATRQVEKRAWKMIGSGWERDNKPGCRKEGGRLNENYAGKKGREGKGRGGRERLEREFQLARDIQQTYQCHL